MPLSRRRPGRAAALALGLVAVLGLVAPPAFAEDHPSWAEVESARADQAQAAGLVAQLESALGNAEAQSAALSAAALEKAAAAEQARLTAGVAAERAAALSAQSDAADAELMRMREELGTLASRLHRVRSDDSLLARLVTSAKPEDLLYRLGLLDRLSATWTGLVAEAQRTAGAAESLSAQALVAETARRDAAVAAERTAAEAQRAADAERAAVATLQSQVATMYAQLAALKDTTAETERLYRLSRQVEEQTGSGPGGSAAPDPSSGSGGSGSGGSESGGSSGGGNGSAPGGVNVDPAGARAYAHGAMAARYGWGDDQYQCLVWLWNRESGWRADARNPYSGAYGIPQALPAEKLAAAGADWRTNGNTQVDWGLSYISGRYGSPCDAWAHSESVGWY